MFRMAFPKELYASKFWAAATDGCDIGILFGLRYRVAAATDGMHSLQNNNMNLETR